MICIVMFWIANVKLDVEFELCIFGLNSNYNLLWDGGTNLVCRGFEFWSVWDAGGYCEILVI